MHTNHRRKSKFRSKHHGHRRWPCGHHKDSYVWYRRQSWRRRRSHARDLIQQQRFDALPDRYRRHILWWLW